MRNTDLPAVPVLLSRDDLTHHTARHARHQGFDQVRRGAFLDLRDLDGPTWAIRRATTLARIRAVGWTMAPNAVVVGWHAAVLHDLPVTVTDVAVTIASPSHPSIRAAHSGVRRHVRHFEPSDITMVDGIRVTTLERTAIDCARLGDPVQGLTVLDAVLARLGRPDRRTSDASEARLAAAHEKLDTILRAEPGRRGNDLARTLLTWADGWAASPFESKARRLVLALGLPRPTAQQVVRARGKTYYTDLSWRFGPLSEQALHLEVDGFAKYTDAAALEAERTRESDIRSLGDLLVRVERAVVRDRSAPDLIVRLTPFLPREVREAAIPRPELMTRWERTHPHAMRFA